MSKWPIVKLGVFIREVKERNIGSWCEDVFSVTNSAGFVASSQYFKKQVYSEDVSSYKIVHPDMIAFNPSRINVGSIALLEKPLPVCVSPLYTVFRVEDDVFDSRFVVHYLKSAEGRAQIRALTSGSVRDSLKWAALEKIAIPRLPFEQQSKLVRDSINVDRLIGGKKSQLDSLDLLVKSRFIEVFGDPVLNTKDLPLRSLGNLGIWKSGGTPKRTRPEYFGGSVNWFSAGELDRLYLRDSVEKITKEALENSSAKLFRKGSLLLGMYDTAAFKMGILTKDSASNQACACITPNEMVNVVWLYHELQLMKSHFLTQRNGVRQKNLNLGMIRKFEVPLPPLPLQQQFAAFAAEVDKSKFAVQQEIEKLETLKQSLMQKYFA